MHKLQELLPRFSKWAYDIFSKLLKNFMVNIKIFGGEREIGGNKILIEFKNTRLMLDFGLSFTQEKKILL
jgi:mRNA degradation ribonuclease J1/J2